MQFAVRTYVCGLLNSFCLDYSLHLCVLAMNWSKNMCFIVFAIFGCVIIVSVHTLAYRADCCLPGAVDEKLFCDIGYFL